MGVGAKSRGVEVRSQRVNGVSRGCYERLPPSIWATPALPNAACASAAAGMRPHALTLTMSHRVELHASELSTPVAAIADQTLLLAAAVEFGAQAAAAGSQTRAHLRRHLRVGRVMVVPLGVGEAIFCCCILRAI